MPLENKLGITDPATLAKEEERISKTRAVELFESGLLASLPFLPIQVTTELSILYILSIVYMCC